MPLLELELLVASNRNQLKQVTVKMEFIINMQGILWNPDEEMQVASGWPGTRSRSAREPWSDLDINWCTFSHLASLCTLASLFLLIKPAISDTTTWQVDNGCP